LSCPAGETEVTISFSNNYDSEQALTSLEWDYAVNGLASDAGPFSLNEPLTTCIPDGELVITVCGDWMVWWNVIPEFKITEDGSVNGCTERIIMDYLLAITTNNLYLIQLLDVVQAQLLQKVVLIQMHPTIVLVLLLIMGHAKFKC